MTMPVDFLQRTGYRLPMESEWEYACRARSVTEWSCGNSEELLRKYCWFQINSFGKSHPVGSLAPNDFGLFDMHGNASEWCQNIWESNEDEQGIRTAKDDDRRVLRGGSFLLPMYFVRSNDRSNTQPSMKNDIGNDIGFRLARTL
jgi:formylglycine-generating enzyme required for sulfatase activity